MTPILASLLWLPVSYKIEYKVPLLVLKALNDMSHSYIADCLSCVNPNQALQSSDSGLNTSKDSHKSCSSL